MKRRELLQAAAFAPFSTLAARLPAAEAFRRVRPGDAGWPSPERWAELGRAVGGRLAPVGSPLQACVDAPDGPVCTDLFKALKNPYFLGDTAGLTQSLGWVDAWTSMPSACAVTAEQAGDVAAAVNFAREHRLRLVVKGGGHSFQGTSNAADSLLVWTRRMNAITLHDDFVAHGCGAAPQPAVSIGAGALWGAVYDAVMTRAGRYVQGGGCLTVGVAGLVQSGGFGSFSKGFGLAAASLLEAEVVTADGAIRLANACTEPELFWALKGGGGGSFGVVTRVTLRTHPLPDTIGAVQATIEARSDAAYRRLLGELVAFCGARLMDPHWGEQIVLPRGNRVRLELLFQGLGRGEASAIWQPFFDRLAAAPEDFRLSAAPLIATLPARHFWDASFMKRLPGILGSDTRPGAPAGNVFWSGDQGSAGQVIHGYASAWLPAALLQPGRQDTLADALFAATRHWQIALHLNKGLAGAPAPARAAALDTATHPAAVDAFALAICGAEEGPAYPGIAGHEPDVARARSRARAIAAAMAALRPLQPAPAAYVAESDFFQADWPLAFWGPNHARLQAAKERYDPDGLFFVHHGVGSERWSADGFTRRD